MLRVVMCMAEEGLIRRIRSMLILTLKGFLNSSKDMAVVDMAELTTRLSLTEHT